MPQTHPYTQVYDLDYFCLTDDNILLCKRNGKICQIIPSEFNKEDQLLSLTKDGFQEWSEAKITTHTVNKGEQIVRLVTQRGTFYLTPGHKMFLEEGGLEAAGNLKPGDRLRYSDRFTLPCDQSIGIDKAYVLGAYAAEGSHQEGLSSVGTGKWRLVWGLHYNENIFATKILSYIISAFPGSNCQIESFSQYTRRTVNSYDKNLVLLFRELGALGLCQDKRVPPCIFTATRQEKAAFLAALIEGDGTFGDNVIALKLTSSALINGAHLLCEDLGINTKLNFSETEDEDTYLLNIYGKDNINFFLSLTSRYLYGWKHLSDVQIYANSAHGNLKYSEKDVQKALENLYPISSTKFSKVSGIPQAAIKRLFGSWNKCLKSFGYKVKNSRWGTDHIPNNRFTRNINKDNGFDKKSNQVIKIDLLTLNQDIEVYDFCIPTNENFLINSICTHNSGSQMFLYIGDVWVDEVTSLQYQCTQHKQPIYGYASQLWDDVAAGHVLVEGSFTINFKEQGYLWAVLRRFKNISGEEVGFSANQDRKLLEARRRNPAIYNKKGMTSISRATVERICYGDATRGDRFKFYHDLAGYSTFKHGSPKDRTFENIAEVFEDQIWDRKLDNSDLNAQIRRTDDNIFDGFDMYVVFGNYTDNRANHTVSKIIDVRLVSQGKQVVIDGSPVSELYTFIARSVA